MRFETLFVPFKIRFRTAEYAHLTDTRRQRVWVENGGDYCAAVNDPRLTRMYHVITHDWGFNLSDPLLSEVDRVKLIARACREDGISIGHLEELVEFNSAKTCQFLSLLNVLRTNDLHLLLDNAAATNVLLFATTHSFAACDRLQDPSKIDRMLNEAIFHKNVDVVRMLFGNVNEAVFLDVCSSPSLTVNEPIANFLNEQPVFVLYEHLRKFYNTESTEWIGTCDTSAYLLKVEKALNRETTTREPGKFQVLAVSICAKELLEVPQKRLIACETSGLVALLEKSVLHPTIEKPKIQRMFQLFSRVDEGLATMAKGFESYVKSCGEELWSDHLNRWTTDRDRDKDPTLMISSHNLLTRCHNLSKQCLFSYVMCSD